MKHYFLYLFIIICVCSWYACSENDGNPDYDSRFPYYTAYNGDSCFAATIDLRYCHDGYGILNFFVDSTLHSGREFVEYGKPGLWENHIKLTDWPKELHQNDTIAFKIIGWAAAKNEHYGFWTRDRRFYVKPI